MIDQPVLDVIDAANNVSRIALVAVVTEGSLLWRQSARCGLHFDPDGHRWKWSTMAIHNRRRRQKRIQIWDAWCLHRAVMRVVATPDGPNYIYRGPECSEELHNGRLLSSLWLLPLWFSLYSSACECARIHGTAYGCAR